VSFDEIMPPPGMPRTATEHLHGRLWRQRMRNAGEPPEIRLPGIHPVCREGLPPAGKFVISQEERRSCRTSSSPSPSSAPLQRWSPARPITLRPTWPYARPPLAWRPPSRQTFV
jgi:hypothetical protein